MRFVEVPRPAVGDAIAGISVALVLVPQALAYAVLAGMRPEQGLVVGAVATIAAAPFVSSPWLQTGPVAITALLTFGALTALATPGSAEYVALGALLALLVGIIRLAIGLARAGAVAYLMSQPVLAGFVPAAAALIALSQLPAALGVSDVEGGVVPAALAVVRDPGSWQVDAIAMSIVALVVVAVVHRIHPLIPGVLIAVVGGIVFSVVAGYGGEVVGDIPDATPRLHLSLRWGGLADLLIPAIVIAIVGFAEAAAIARTFASTTRTLWDADREFVSQGVANLAAGMFGGFPVGGSFSRSAVSHVAGARTAWTGAITGIAVLGFLPFADVLASLPRAVLAAIIIGSVLKLLRPGPILQLRRYSRIQFAIALTTFALTIALSPQIQWAIVIGVGLAIGAHLRRELMISSPAWTEGSSVHLRPQGVLYFGSAHVLETQLLSALHDHPDADRLVVHFDRLGRVDVTGALAIRSLCEEATAAGLEPVLTDLTPASQKIVRRVLADCPSAVLEDQPSDPTPVRSER